MFASARQNGLNGGKRGDGPQANHRLAGNIGGGRGKLCGQCFAKAHTIHRAHQHFTKAMRGPMPQRGGKAREWPHAGGGPIGQNRHRGIAAAHHHHCIALAGKRRYGLIEKWAAMQQGQRFVAAKAAGLPARKDRAQPGHPQPCHPKSSGQWRSADNTG